MDPDIIFTPVTKAYTIGLALEGSICPHCGKQCDELLGHIRHCTKAVEDRKIDSNTSKQLWAVHDSLGKVMVLERGNGLCLVEGELGRCVVSISSLVFGALSEVLGVLEQQQLSDDEIAYIINTLRLQSSNRIKIPNSPELPIGSIVEVQMGKHVKRGDVVKKVGSCYAVSINGHKHTINISFKNILKVV